MKHFAYILSLLCLLASVGCESKASSRIDERPLILDLAFDKPTYHPGESVLATFELTNSSQENLLIYGRMGFIRKLTPLSLSVGNILIWNPSGEFIPDDAFVDIQWMPKEEDFIVLQSNSSVSRSFHVRGAEDFRELGVYRVIAVYQNSFDPKDVVGSTDPRTAWKGTVTSNLETFELVP